MKLLEFIYTTIVIAIFGYFVIYPFVQAQIYADENQTTFSHVIASACVEKDLCPKFASNRNECAVAYDFEKCMKIKGDSDYRTYFCAVDGSSKKTREINVNALFCSVTHIATKIKQ